MYIFRLLEAYNNLVDYQVFILTASDDIGSRRAKKKTYYIEC